MLFAPRGFGSASWPVHEEIFENETKRPSRVIEHLQNCSELQ
jgi:hypothetical protein